MNERLAKLALITENMINTIPEVEGKEELITWLNNSPYSPYVSLYGGENSLSYDESKSFTSELDGKRRYLLEDEINFKLENFIKFDESILSANTKLLNIIEAKELFEAYPEFKDIEASINISNAQKGVMSGAMYHDNQKANRIEIFADSNETAMQVLIHELQHSIQVKEGFQFSNSIYKENDIEKKIINKGSGRDITYDNFLYTLRLGRKDYEHYEYSKEIWDNLFPNGYIQTPYENVKLGESQFDKLNPKIPDPKNSTRKKEDRRGHIFYIYEVLKNPTIYLKEENGDMNYIKEFTNKNKEKLISSIIINKEELNISVSTHQKKPKQIFKKIQKGEVLDVSIPSQVEVTTDWATKSNLTSTTVAINDSIPNNNSCVNKKEESTRNTRSTSTDSSFNKILTYKEKNVNEKQLNAEIDSKTRQEALDEWFGDSKVVDENGEPLVVYHGSQSEDKIQEFRFDKNGLAFFTTAKYVAKDFATQSDDGEFNIYQVYIKSEKIFDPNNEEHIELLSNKFELNDELNNEVLKHLWSDINYHAYKTDLEELEKLFNQSSELTDFFAYLENEDVGQDYTISGFAEDIILHKNIKNALSKLSWEGGWNIYEKEEYNIVSKIKGLGFDSFKTFERIDNENIDYNIAVFNPTQIKSIHNKGSFDSNNPSILEKNDYGFKQIDKALSIIPDEMKISSVEKYLNFNGISRNLLKDTKYEFILNQDRFDSSIVKIKEVTDLDYLNSPKEKESREIEELYLNKLDDINIEDIQAVSDFANTLDDDGSEISQNQYQRMSL